MSAPLFIATERFDPADGERWQRYFEWARIPGLMEVVSLDALLCPRLVREPHEADWAHIVCEDYHPDEPHAQCEMYALWRLK
jgi:hypothetical protein